MIVVVDHHDNGHLTLGRDDRLQDCSNKVTERLDDWRFEEFRYEKTALIAMINTFYIYTQLIWT
jgi:hypothetical protein